MIEHFALQFCEAYAKLARHIDAVLLRETEDRPKQLKDRELGDGYKRFVAQEAIAPIMSEIERLGFDAELVGRVKRLFARLADPNSRSWTAELLLDSLTEIRRAIGLELQKHKFAHLHSPNGQYFEQERLFGDEVYKKFKSARQEIRDAGNCLAVSLPTASVF